MTAVYFLMCYRQLGLAVHYLTIDPGFQAEANQSNLSSRFSFHSNGSGELFFW